MPQRWSQSSISFSFDLNCQWLSICNLYLDDSCPWCTVQLFTDHQPHVVQNKTSLAVAEEGGDGGGQGTSVDWWDYSGVRLVTWCDSTDLYWRECSITLQRGEGKRRGRSEVKVRTLDRPGKPARQSEGLFSGKQARVSSSWAPFTPICFHSGLTAGHLFVYMCCLSARRGVCLLCLFVLMCFITRMTVNVSPPEINTILGCVFSFPLYRCVTLCMGMSVYVFGW